MTKWANTAVSNATNDEERARLLFSALFQGTYKPSKEGRRTAVEMFQELKSSPAKFICQEGAFLFIALTRDIGLRTYFVSVDEDCRGRLVRHACAGVFLGAKVLLVDPTYHWFGAPPMNSMIFMMIWKRSAFT